MAENTIHVRASRAALRQAIDAVPGEAATGGGSAADAMLRRCGLVILGHIKQAFVTKARGGVDESGDSWAPLSPKTIAYSRRGRSRTEKKRAARPSQALNNKQQERWWELYRQGLAISRGNKGHAARYAWSVLKGEGATTLLDKYGNRQVEILRDTGLLLNSLSPGMANSNQIFLVRRGEVIVGTNRKGAAAHHHGVPGRLPQRRLWPEPSKWPDSWWQDLTEQVRDGLVLIAAQAIRNARS